MCDFCPDCSLADEDKEDEEPSEDVEAVNCSEENIQGWVLTFLVIVDDGMDAFTAPEYSKNKEELCVKGLRDKQSIH